MDNETQEIINVLAQAYGPEEARRISGSYRLAMTMVRMAAQQEQAAQPPEAEASVPPPPPQPNGKASQGAVREARNGAVEAAEAAEVS